MAEPTTETRPAETGDARPRSGVTLVVAAAVCLVGYSYLGGLWCNRHGYTPRELELIRSWVNRPLALGQDFGLLGIALLLIAGGYLVTGTVLTASQRSAPVRLLARWYPPVLVTIGIGFAVLALGGEPLTAGSTTSWPVRQVLENLLLADRATGAPSVVALAWAPAVGALYTVSLLLVRACCGGRWVPSVLIRVAALIVVTATAAGTTGDYHRAGLLTVMVALPLFGELIRLVRSARLLSAAAGTSLAAVLLGTVIWADQSYRELTGWYMPMAALYAVLLMLVAVTSGGGVLAGTRVVRWLASRGYWLYLLIGVLGYPTLTVLHDHRITLVVAYVVAVPVTLLGAEAGYRLQVLATRLTGRVR